MRILILSQYFQPENFFKGLPLAKALQQKGHEVEVVTGFPNYPGGEVYTGYRIRLKQRDIIDGVQVTRLAHYPSHDGKALGRIANYMSLGLTAASLGPFVTGKVDVVYVYNLITLNFAARVFRLFKGAPYVIDVQDLWPESVTGSGMLPNRWIQRAVERWSAAAYASANRLVVLSPGFKKNLATRGIDEERIDVVYNWCDEGDEKEPPVDSQFAETNGYDGRFNIVFAGTMGVMQGLDVVVAAARKLASTAPEVKFHLYGGGVEVARLKQESAALTNVQFHQQVSNQEIRQVYGLADALLVHLRDIEPFNITIPSKIQAYLHAGRPVLCGVRGDAADLIERADAGYTFTPEDPQDLASAVCKLQSQSPQRRIQVGHNARRFYETHLSFSQGVDKIEAALTEAAGIRAS